MNLSGLTRLIEDLAPLRALTESLVKPSQGPISIAITDAVKPALVVALARTLNRPTLLVTAQATRARSIAESVQALSSVPARAALLAEHDSLFYERLLADSPLIQARLSTLALLSESHLPYRDGPPIVISSVRALMHRLLPKESFGEYVSNVRQGARVRPDALAQKWSALGYTHLPLVEEPGVFSRRGGILDIFPIGWPRPVRLEFFGDEVDTIRFFDPTTQRSLDPLDSVQVLPAHEIFPHKEPSAPDAIIQIEQLRKLDLSRLLEGHRARFSREIEQIRLGETFEGIEFYAPYLPGNCLTSYLPDDALVILDEPSRIAASAQALEKQAEELHVDLESRGELPPGFLKPYYGWRELLDEVRPKLGLELSWAAAPTSGHENLTEALRPVYPYGGRLKIALDEADSARRDGHSVVLITRQARRVEELLQERDVTISIVTDLPDKPAEGSLSLVYGSLDEGFEAIWPLPDNSGKEKPRVRSEGIRVLTDRELFGWSKPNRQSRPRATARQALLSELTEGDYVVHIEHGVGRYAGIQRMSDDDLERDYLVIEYAQSDRLFVPTDQADRVERYIGPGDGQPTLSRLGSQEWARAKSRVKAAVQQMAEELLELYASRQAKPGHAFSPDTPWQYEMETAFPYIETPDQMEAINQIKSDMEHPRPMDRLLCGDVGYGKTEVAIRAAFKAVMDGKQVAVLVPTTVLAQQHFSTFKERLGAFPAKVEMLSRFRSEKEQRKVLADLVDGKVDIVIGTHRIIQKDVEFKDLGLLIVDEEQRFGVAHKERLKQLRQEIDVLTLTATPIPRTLHMALAGVRDMSTIETPPEDRLPIKTYVSEYEESRIKEAILRELDRGGQIFFVHNRVQTIYGMAHKIHELVPEASIAVGHGQMHEDELENVMVEFSSGRLDILVCSTIIESGLDIPNVNTIIVNRADMFGLAQLYQLRGRVGRGANRAYAYFLYPKGRELSEIAQRRLRAIFEATELGSGFCIAMKDLEIRGAGNLLGPEQHGHIAAVGFHLYSQLLAEAVKRLKGEVVKQHLTVSVDLPLAAFLPEDYVTDEQSRLALYSRLASVTDFETLGGLSLEMRDRFGPPPPPAMELLYLVQLKVLSAEANVSNLTAEEGDILIVPAAPGLVDRDDLRRRFGERIRLGVAQIRVSLKPKGESWQDLLQQVLEALGESARRKVDGALGATEQLSAPRLNGPQAEPKGSTVRKLRSTSKAAPEKTGKAKTAKDSAISRSALEQTPTNTTEAEDDPATARKKAGPKAGPKSHREPPPTFTKNVVSRRGRRS